MIANVQIKDKSFGALVLHSDLQLKISAGDKIGLVGRNGTGKTTLLDMIAGIDTDYDGQVDIRRGLSVVASRQEHHDLKDVTVLDYIASDLPEFAELDHIIKHHPEKMESAQVSHSAINTSEPAALPTGKTGVVPGARLMQEYSDALDRFTQLGYFNIAGDVEAALSNYRLDTEVADRPLSSLSGGQKRLIELIKVQRSNAGLALVDEPTNHMDYKAKQFFVDWFKSTDSAVVVISHDRDVLKAATKIIELRDGRAFEYPGNYDDYLRSNTVRISAELNEYQVTKQRIKNLRDSIVRYQRLKEKARDPDTIKQFKRLEREAKDELSQLESQGKPSFWIDQQSAATIKPKVAAAYEQHKDKNIAIRTKDIEAKSTRLLQVHGLSLGYEGPLFKEVGFEMRAGDRVELRGLNGAGKTTLVQAVIDTVNSSKLKSLVVSGTIDADKSLRLGVYHQEIDSSWTDYSLSEAIEAAYGRHDQTISDQRIKSLLNQYLFNAHEDFDKPLNLLSGGQKARVQLIDMLASDPNLLILDEPTNHLDLPSIEELESALTDFTGAIIYISHDSYFRDRLGGQIVELKPIS